MKAFNIIMSGLALAVFGSFGISILCSYFMGQNAVYVSMPLAFLLGLSSRVIVEKIYGYTLLEALQETNSNEPKH